MPTRDPDAPLTPEDRRRNVERVKRIEERLGQVERVFAENVFSTSKALRELHAMRQELRGVFGMEALPDLAPLFAGLAKQADEEDEG